MISWGMISGLTLSETLDASPGFVLDLFLMRRKYDDEQHFIKRKHASEWSDE